MTLFFLLHLQSPSAHKKTWVGQKCRQGEQSWMVVEVKQHQASMPSLRKKLLWGERAFKTSITTTTHTFRDRGIHQGEEIPPPPCVQTPPLAWLLLLRMKKRQVITGAEEWWWRWYSSIICSLCWVAEQQQMGLSSPDEEKRHMENLPFLWLSSEDEHCSSSSDSYMRGLEEFTWCISLMMVVSRKMNPQWQWQQAIFPERE